MPLTWGQALQYRAQAVGLTKAKDLASATGLSPTSISNYYAAPEMPDLQPATRDRLRLALQLEDERDLARIADLVMQPDPTTTLADLLRRANPWELTRALISIGLDGELAARAGEQLSLHQRGSSRSRSTPSNRPASAP